MRRPPQQNPTLAHTIPSGVILEAGLGASHDGAILAWAQVDRREADILHAPLNNK